MNYRNAILMPLSLIALTACGSSGGGSVFQAPDLGSAARVFSDDTGDAGDALAAGETLTARTVTTSAIRLDYNDSRGGPTALVSNPDLAIRLNDDGELTLIIEGQEQVFSAANYDPDDGGIIYGYFTEEECDTLDICNNLFSFSGTLDEFKASGNGYHKIYIAQTNQLYGDGALNLRAYGAAGTETRDDALTSLGSASYSGRSRIDAYPTSGFVDNGTTRTRLQSDVALDANFGAGTISGVMSNFETRGPGEDDWTSIDGTIAMSSSSFESNGFQGNLTPDADWRADTNASLTGTYSGAFFGPNAEEAAGGISASGTDDELGDFNAIGFFSTNAD